MRVLDQRVVLAGDRLPTGGAVIVVCHTTVYVPFRFDFEMFTERWRIVLLPLCLEVTGLSLCHATSSRGFSTQRYRQVGLRQSHMGKGSVTRST